MTLTLKGVHEVPTPRAEPTRRALVAFAAGAIAFRAVLPRNLKADGTVKMRPGLPGAARTELNRLAAVDPITAGMLAWWDAAGHAERHCFITMLKRVDAGIPVQEAGRRFKLEAAGQTDARGDRA